MSMLVVNAGSSSLKTVLYDDSRPDLTRLAEYRAANIGQERSTLDSWAEGTEKATITLPLSDHQQALQVILDTINKSVPTGSIDTIAYRVVYGGKAYYQPTIITDVVRADLATFSDIDPEHAPVTLAIIDQLRRTLPGSQHIACFDTAYFHDIPDVAQIVPIPRAYRDLGIRRFGYHGLSYDYLSDTFGVIAGETARRGRVIYAHLGSGASMAATANGKPVDMTMGVTPVSGLVMGSRTGDIDPGLAWSLATQANLSIDQYQHMINHESGLLAVSELSSDMYELIQAQATNPDAALAVELFCYQARKAIGALVSTINGIDSLVFSGGIGEQSAEIRRRISDGLSFLGITIDNDANERHDRLISAPNSQVGVHVIPTDESLSIARSIVSMKTKDRQ